MITYINQKNAEAYSELYSQANAALKDKGLDGNITNVEEYLANLSKLAKIDTKFVRLPIDEEVFEVNVDDTRTITVPQSFRRNGVGVVGDELAEIVYFKIARFFDIADLASEGMQIFIQWENASGDKGASKAYAIDVQTETDEAGNANDFVYFGWALSSAITGRAGTVKFNVRILKIGTAATTDGEAVRTIEYSFNTQVANVTIKAGLNFDFTKEFTDVIGEIGNTDKIFVEEPKDLVAARLLEGNTAHSPVIDDNIKSVAFIGDELVLNVHEIVHDSSEKVDAEGNTYREDNHTDNQPVITYKWYYKKPEETVFNRVYTTTVVEDGEEKEVAVGPFTKALTVTAAGQYYVVAFATYKIVDTVVYDGDEEIELEYHTSTASAKSIICVAPKPEPVKIEKDLDNKFIIVPDAFMEVKGGQQVVTLADGSKENAGVLELVIYRADDRDVEGGLISDLKKLEFSEYDSEGKLNILYGNMVENKEDGSVAFVESATGRVIRIVPTDAADASVEGYYKVAIKNKLNNFSELSEESRICRVTFAPQSPVLGAVGDTDKHIQVLTSSGNAATATPSVTKHHQLKALFTEVGSSDELLVNWFREIGEKDPELEGDEQYSDDELIVDADDKPVNAVIFSPTEAGTYYFVITNRLNGEEIISDRSNSIVVNA